MHAHTWAWQCVSFSFFSMELLLPSDHTNWHISIESLGKLLYPSPSVRHTFLSLELKIQFKKYTSFFFGTQFGISWWSYTKDLEFSFRSGKKGAPLRLKFLWNLVLGTPYIHVHMYNISCLQMIFFLVFISNMIGLLVFSENIR